MFPTHPAMIRLLLLCCILIIAATGDAQVTLPVLSDPAFRLLGGETILKSQLSSWGVQVGPIDVKLELSLPTLPVKLPKLLGLRSRVTRRDGPGHRGTDGLVKCMEALRAMGYDEGRVEDELEDVVYESEDWPGLVLEDKYESICSDLLDMDQIDYDRRELNLDPALKKRLLGIGASLGLGDGLKLGLGVQAGSGWGEAENVARGERGDTEWYTYITVGTRPQSIPILPDTGSSDMFVFAQDCSSCFLNNHSSFNPSSSSTFAKIDGSFDLEYADGSAASGGLGMDVVGFGQTNTVSARLTFGLATSNSGSNFRDSARSGVLGLGLDAMSTIPNGTTLFSQLAQSGQIREKVLSIRLEKGKKSRGVTSQEGGGSYLFGGVDGRYIRGDRLGVKYVDVTSSNYWGFPLDDISVGLVTTLLTDTETPRRAIIDTGTSLIITSDVAAFNIHRQIPGSTQAKSGVWYIPCAVSWPKIPNLFFTIGGVRYGVPIEDLAWKASAVYPDLCISGAQGGMPHFTVLGDMFIKNRYVVLSYEGDKPRVGLGERSDVPLIL